MLRQLYVYESRHLSKIQNGQNTLARQINVQKVIFIIRNQSTSLSSFFYIPLPEILAPPTMARNKDDRKHQAHVHVPQVEGRRMVELARAEYSAACTLISDMSVCASYMNNRLHALSRCLKTMLKIEKELLRNISTQLQALNEVS